MLFIYLHGYQKIYEKILDWSTVCWHMFERTLLNCTGGSSLRKLTPRVCQHLRGRCGETLLQCTSSRLWIYRGGHLWGSSEDIYIALCCNRKIFVEYCNTSLQIWLFLRFSVIGLAQCQTGYHKTCFFKSPNIPKYKEKVATELFQWLD